MNTKFMFLILVLILTTATGCSKKGGGNGGGSSSPATAPQAAEEPAPEASPTPEPTAAPTPTPAPTPDPTPTPTPTATPTPNPNLVAYNLAYSGAQGALVNITLKATHSTADPIQYAVRTNPANGTLSGTAPNLIYQPNSTFSGSDSFTYTATDNVGTSNTATVRIIIGGSALFVVAGAASLNASDNEVRNRLVSLGFTVFLVSATASTTANATAKDIVLISSSSGSADITTKYRDVTVPVLTWERNLYDDMKMTGATATDNGSVNAQTQIDIVDSTHPLAAGLSGTVTVFNTADAIVWGKLNANAKVVATVKGDANKPVLFVYETGAMMAGGLAAPARRVGYFLPDNTGTTLTTNGLKLLDAAINSALTQ